MDGDQLVLQQGEFVCRWGLYVFEKGLLVGHFHLLATQEGDEIDQEAGNRALGSAARKWMCWRRLARCPMGCRVLGQVLELPDAPRRVLPHENLPFWPVRYVLNFFSSLTMLQKSRSRSRADVGRAVPSNPNSG